MLDSEEEKKKSRKRAKRPGAPRTSKMKRERRSKNKAASETAQAKENSGDTEADQKLKKPKGRIADDHDEDFDNRAWVGGLPAETDEQALLEHFRACGQVRSIKLVRNSRGVFRGSCFVSFKAKSGLQASLDLDDTEFKGQAIKVKKAAPPVDRQALQVYVGGIPRQATEKVLRKDFGDCGEIVRFTMLKDRQTSKFRGVIFVTYKTKTGCDAALKYNGTDYGGKTLLVRMASADDGEAAKAAEKETDPALAKSKAKRKRETEEPAEGNTAADEETGPEPAKGKDKRKKGKKEPTAGNPAADKEAEPASAKSKATTKKEEPEPTEGASKPTNAKNKKKKKQ